MTQLKPWCTVTEHSKSKFLNILWVYRLFSLARKLVANPHSEITVGQKKQCCVTVLVTVLYSISEAEVFPALRVHAWAVKCFCFWQFSLLPDYCCCWQWNIGTCLGCCVCVKKTFLLGPQFCTVAFYENLWNKVTKKSMALFPGLLTEVVFWYSQSLICITLTMLLSLHTILKKSAYRPLGTEASGHPSALSLLPVSSSSFPQVFACKS